MQQMGDSGTGRDQLRLMRAGDRQDTESPADEETKSSLDRGGTLKKIRRWAIETVILLRATL
jgi:hypothetical protein